MTNYKKVLINLDDGLSKEQHQHLSGFLYSYLCAPIKKYNVFLGFNKRRALICNNYNSHFLSTIDSVIDISLFSSKYNNDFTNVNELAYFYKSLNTSNVFEIELENKLSEFSSLTYFLAVMNDPRYARLFEELNRDRLIEKAKNFKHFFAVTSALVPSPDNYLNQVVSYFLKRIKNLGMLSHTRVNYSLEEESEPGSPDQIALLKYYLLLCLKDNTIFNLNLTRTFFELIENADQKTSMYDYASLCSNKGLGILFSGDLFLYNREIHKDDSGINNSIIEDIDYRFFSIGRLLYEVFNNNMNLGFDNDRIKNIWNDIGNPLPQEDYILNRYRLKNFELSPYKDTLLTKLFETSMNTASIKSYCHLFYDIEKDNNIEVNGDIFNETSINQVKDAIYISDIDIIHKMALRNDIASKSALYKYIREEIKNRISIPNNLYDKYFGQLKYLFKHFGNPRFNESVRYFAKKSNILSIGKYYQIIITSSNINLSLDFANMLLRTIGTDSYSPIIPEQIRIYTSQEDLEYEGQPLKNPYNIKFIMDSVSTNLP